MDSTNHGLCSIVMFTIEKYLHKGGSTQFKSMLLKGQLYILKDLLINNTLLSPEDIYARTWVVLAATGRQALGERGGRRKAQGALTCVLCSVTHSTL